MILEENNERILEENEVLEEILDYLSNISRKLDLVQIRLSQILNKDEMKFKKIKGGNPKTGVSTFITYSIVWGVTYPPHDNLDPIIEEHTLF